MVRKLTHSRILVKLVQVNNFTGYNQVEINKSIIYGLHLGRVIYTSIHVQNRVSNTLVNSGSMENVTSILEQKMEMVTSILGQRE